MGPSQRVLSDKVEAKAGNVSGDQGLGGANVYTSGKPFADLILKNPFDAIAS